MKIGKQLITIYVLALVGVLFGAVPAQAAAQSCNGELRGVINGNLIVSAGQHCLLQASVVNGDVKVEADAELSAIDTRIVGNIRAHQRAGVALLDTTVDGDMRVQNGEALFAQGSTITGHVWAKDTNGVDLTDTIIGRNVDVSGKAVFYAIHARVGGDLSSVNTQINGVHASEVGGNLVVEQTEQSSVVCGNAVGGNATFQQNKYSVQIGDDEPPCAGNTVYGHLNVTGTLGRLEIANNTVGKNLACDGNQPAPFGRDNNVAGQKQGQCRDL